MSSIVKTIKIIGGHTATERLLGVKKGSTWGWVNIRQQAPAKYIERLSIATRGEVSILELLRDHE